MEEAPIKEVEIKRPPSLTILCILTFIGSGMSSFSNLFLSLMYYSIPEMIKQLKGMDMLKPQMEMLTTIPRPYFIYGFILSFASLFGAILMFKLKKPGFHFYTASQLLMIIVTMIYLGTGIPFESTLFTLSFIALYAMNLRFMKA